MYVIEKKDIDKTIRNVCRVGSRELSRVEQIMKKAITTRLYNKKRESEREGETIQETREKKIHKKPP